MRLIILILSSSLLIACGGSLFNKAPTHQEIEQQIALGNFANAKRLIALYLTNDSITPLERYSMNFRKEQLERIEQDFNRNDTFVLNYIKEHHPNVTNDQVEAWEKSNVLENLTIDGNKRYFYAAARNLFRIDKEAASYFKLPNEGQSDSLNRFLKWYIPTLVAKGVGERHIFVSPVTMKVKYTLTVKPDEVPAGEMIRVWMPLPREDVPSQKSFELLWSSQPEYIISPDSYAHKSIYMEREAVAGEPTIFSYEFRYTSFGQVHLFDPQQIEPYDTTSTLYKEFTVERAPHILFSDRIKGLVAEIVGQEQNPYYKVKKIYEWIDSNFPWASAREYSTIDNIPEYVLDNNHGDCGQVSLLFITMARAAGIPAKWQSGWMMHPGNKNLHDWAEVYYQGIGWVPVDQSFGRVKGNENNPDYYYFFTRGLDPYRLIVNQDISRPFYPAKIYPRSESVDFQRGEVEWRGENLYFGRWRYNMEIEYLKSK